MTATLIILENDQALTSPQVTNPAAAAAETGVEMTRTAVEAVAATRAANKATAVAVNRAVTRLLPHSDLAA